MREYSQKWTLVQLLEELPEGSEYHFKDWPLHVTIADIFAVDWESTNLFEKLSELLSNHKPVKTTAENDAYLGPPGHRVKVTTLQATPKLQALHDDVISVLSEAGAEFNNPQYTGKGYMPHITSQKQNRLNKSDEVTIDAITIIDMFPGGNHEKRKVLKTIKLSR